MDGWMGSHPFRAFTVGGRGWRTSHHQPPPATTLFVNVRRVIPHSPVVPVKLDHAMASGTLVQAVNILLGWGGMVGLQHGTHSSKREEGGRGNEPV
jgi:hypothetical protein